MSEPPSRCPVCDSTTLGAHVIKLLRPSALDTADSVDDLRDHAMTGVVCSNCGVVYRC